MKDLVCVYKANKEVVEEECQTLSSDSSKVCSAPSLSLEVSHVNLTLMFTTLKERGDFSNAVEI